MTHAVVTTIQPPTPSLRQLARCLQACSSPSAGGRSSAKPFPDTPFPDPSPSAGGRSSAKPFPDTPFPDPSPSAGGRSSAKPFPDTPFPDSSPSAGGRSSATPSTIFVIGDKQGPRDFDLAGTDLVTFDAQLDLPFALAKLLPAGHYARKNLGYLLAIRAGATCIYETDDDNAPNPHWQPRQRRVQAQPLAPRPWANVYQLFTSESFPTSASSVQSAVTSSAPSAPQPFSISAPSVVSVSSVVTSSTPSAPSAPIWPRGFPLERVTDPATYAHNPSAATVDRDCPIQQGLADLSPDVDAVWRLILDREITFADRPSVWLPPRTWCPFNSQSTWWWPPAFPLLYLPSHCSFRMTDIWRSFIAQRCLWELGYGLVFHAAEAIQQRNPHNLLRDFEQELPGYLHNQTIVTLLENLALAKGPQHLAANLRACYQALVQAKILPAAELPLLEAWLTDLEQEKAQA